MEGLANPGSWTTKNARLWSRKSLQIGAILIVSGIGICLLLVRSEDSWIARPDTSSQGQGKCEVRGVACNPNPAGVAKRSSGAKAVVIEPVSPVHAANHWCSRGITLISRSQLDDAVVCFREAIRFVPHHEQARSNLGAVLYQLGQVDQAIPHLQAAIRINSDAAEAHYTLASIYLAQGNTVEAINHFHEVVRLKPEDIEGLLNLGILLAEKGKVAEAIGRFREVMRLDSGRLPVARQLAWYLATYPDESIRNATEAIELAERVARTTQYRDPVVLDTLAAAYANANQFDDAKRWASYAVSLAERLQDLELAKVIERRAKLYKDHKPYRIESSLATSVSVTDAGTGDL